MKSILNLSNLFVLLAVVGISVWTIGCGESADTETTPDASLGNGDEEGDENKSSAGEGDNETGDTNNNDGDQGDAEKDANKEGIDGKTGGDDGQTDVDNDDGNPDEAGSTTGGGTNVPK